MHSVNGSFTNPHITFQAHQIGLYAKRQPAQPSREKVWRKRCNTLYTYTSFLVLRVGVPLCRRYACRYPLWAPPRALRTDWPTPPVQNAARLFHECSSFSCQTRALTTTPKDPTKK